MEIYSWRFLGRQSVWVGVETEIIRVEVTHFYSTQKSCCVGVNVTKQTNTRK